MSYVIYHLIIQFLLIGETIGSPSDDLSQLKAALFGSYDPDIRPSTTSEFSPAVSVNFSLFISNIGAIDESSGYAELSFYVELEWMDNRLIWLPVEFQPKIDCIFMPANLVWAPKVDFLWNLIAQKERKKDNLLAAVCSDGYVTTNTYSTIVISNDFDVSNFPFDNQTLEITIGHPLAGISYMDVYPKIQRISDYRKIGYSLHDHSTEWALVDFLCARKVDRYNHSRTYTIYPFVRCNLFIQRKPDYYVINFCIPSILVTFLAITGVLCAPSFVRKKDSGAQFGLMTLMCLSVLVLNVVDELPKADAISRLYRFYLGLISIVVCSTLLSSLLTYRIYCQGKKRKIVRRAPYLIYGIALCCLGVVVIWFFKPPTPFASEEGF